MNCEQARTLFDAYLDGELSGSLAAELGAHKLRCASCRRELALLEVAGHVIASDTQTPLLSEEFTERLLAYATQRPRRWYQHRLVRYGSPFLAAAACLGFVIGYAVWPTTPEQRVLPAVQVVDSPEQLLRNVESALSHDPDNPRLQKMAETLRSRLQDIKDGATELEDSLKSTAVDVLGSIRLEAPREGDSGKKPASSSDEHHEAAVEDL